MRKSAVFVLLLSMLLCLSSCAVRNSGQDSSGESGDGYDLVFQGVKYKLTFEDEFEGDTQDVSKWEYCPDTWDRGDFYWSDDAARVENGNLILSVLPKDGTEYYCGGIRSRGLFEQAYGCFEITCVLPAYPGVCNAFWLMCDAMGSNQVAGGTDGVEIDIFETSDPAKRSFQHALHWDGYGEQYQSSARTVNPNLFKTNIYDGNYHTFTFVWSKESYSFYVDGEETWKTSDGGICQIPLYMKVTAQIMGWTGTFDGNLVPCDVMYVDSVRVYTAAE